MKQSWGETSVRSFVDQAVISVSVLGRANVPLLVATTALLALMSGDEIGAQQTPRFRERVNVGRIIIDARVLDDRGNPVLGLTADDFKVRIDGQATRVETATWIGERGAEIDPSSLASMSPADDGLHDDGRSRGRLVVFLFQKDLEPSRIVGLMRMLFKSRRFLDTLTASDRVAILSFDSHLKIWSDFTNDRERLDPARGRRTYGIEQALELIGEALEPLPGSKSLVLVGYGFGRLGLGGMRMENDYEPARRALVAARTSVFSLDVTNADYHSLEAGLQLVSEETGGFYVRTHIFSDQAMSRLSGALAGYYVLFVEKPDSLGATHDIKVALTRHKGRVLASNTFSERNE